MGKLSIRAPGIKTCEPLEPRRLFAATALFDPAAALNAGITGLTTLNDRFYFFADTTAKYSIEAQRQLWTSDGTRKGTIQLTTDLPKGDNTYRILSAALGGKMYFTLDRSIWQSDGTAKGTRRVTPAASADSSFLVATSDAVYFDAGYSKTGYELYCYDEAHGFRLTRNIQAGGKSSTPINATPIGNLLYFSARDDAHGRELWRTDGSADGTVLVSDAIPGPGSSSPTNVVAFNSRIYFGATDPLSRGEELWVTDDTTAGAHLFTDISTPTGHAQSIAPLANLGKRLVFAAGYTPPSGTSSSYGFADLWTTDGKGRGTKLLAHYGASVRSVAVLGQKLLFTVPTPDDSPHNTLHSTDGLTVDAQSSQSDFFLAVKSPAGDRVYFGDYLDARHPYGTGPRGLFQSDTTRGANFAVPNGEFLAISSDEANPFEIAIAGNKVFVNARGNGYAYTTSSGTNLFAVDISGGSISGCVFADHNRDNIRQSDEGENANFTVYLDQNANGVLDAGEAKTITDAYGNYHFAGLKPGTYRVRVNVFAGQTPTAGVYSVRIEPGRAFSRDFGVSGGSTIAGTLINDANRNGVADAGETGLPGCTLHLDLNGSGALDPYDLTTTTDAAGHYSIADLAPGKYLIIVDRIPAYPYIDPVAVTTKAGHTTTHNFIATPTHNALANLYVFHDANHNGSPDPGEEPLEAATVDHGDIDYTDGDGKLLLEFPGPSNIDFSISATGYQTMKFSRHFTMDARVTINVGLFK